MWVRATTGLNSMIKSILGFNSNAVRGRNATPRPPGSAGLPRTAPDGSVASQVHQRSKFAARAQAHGRQTVRRVRIGKTTKTTRGDARGQWQGAMGCCARTLHDAPRRERRTDYAAATRAPVSGVYAQR